MIDHPCPRPDTHCHTPPAPRTPTPGSERIVAFTSDPLVTCAAGDRAADRIMVSEHCHDTCCGSGERTGQTLRQLFAKVVLWRIRLKWYIIALCVPIAITFAAIGLYVFFGNAIRGFSIIPVEA